MFLYNYVHVISCSSAIFFCVIITRLVGILCENVIISRLFRSCLQHTTYERLYHCNSLYAQATMMPPRDFASRQNHCGGNSLQQTTFRLFLTLDPSIKEVREDFQLSVRAQATHAILRALPARQDPSVCKENATI